MKSILKNLVWVFAFLAFTSGAISANDTRAEKDWTILVFLNGDNNLDSYGTKDMEEMQKVGSSDRVNVLVLRDTSKTSTSTKIFYVEKGSSKTIKDFGKNIDMGDYRQLVDFFKFAKANYPAKKYFVDIWNHGAGWERKDLEDIVTRGISYDDHSGNHITTLQLGEAFRQMAALNGGKKIDLLGMDACLMEMAEVIYEVKDGVDVVVGSEETEPGDGWAYDGFLPYLANQPGMNAEELGVAVEREYAKSYDGGSQGRQPAQGSVVSTARLFAAQTTFNSYLARLTELAGLHNKPLNRVIGKTQDYAMAQYKDMIHFIELTKEAVEDEELRVLADRSIAEFEQAIIANFVVGSGLEDSHGFSVWIPGTNLYSSKKTEYAKLAWAKQTLWQAFLQELLYPTKPLLEITKLAVVDENQDAFVTPGEKLAINLEIENSSTTAANNVVVRLVTDSGLLPVVGTVNAPSLENGANAVVGLIAQVDPATAPGVYTIKVAIDIPGMGTMEKSLSIGVDKEYTVDTYNLESPHPYATSFSKTWTIEKTGATVMRAHFSRIATEARYDYVYVMDKHDKVILKIDGKKDGFWSPIVEGDTIKIKLTSDNAVSDWGFAIDKIAY